MPARPHRAHFAKEDFLIDVEADTCTCPAGNVAPKSRGWGTRTDHAGRKYRLRGFRFDAAVCRACPLRDRCVAGKSGAGRTVQLHPQEGLFQRARELQRNSAFEEHRRLRVVEEHRLARLVQLGIRQARYIGRVKTKFPVVSGIYGGQPDTAGWQAGPCRPLWLRQWRLSLRSLFRWTW